MGRAWAFVEGPGGRKMDGLETTGKVNEMKAQLRNGAAFAIIALAAVSAFLLPSSPRAAEETMLLSGKITSSTGEALAGIPVKARRANSTMTVAVYSNAKGEYSFPSWSDVTPGSYAVTVE